MRNSNVFRLVQIAFSVLMLFFICDFIDEKITIERFFTFLLVLIALARGQQNLLEIRKLLLGKG